MVTQVTLTARASHGLRKPVGLVSVAMEFVRIPKTSQHRIVPGRFEELQERPKYFVQDWIRVADVEIEREQGATKMEFRLIIERAASVVRQPVSERPAQDVAEGVEIKMKIERHAIIQAEIVVVDRAVMQERHAEGDCLFILLPDKKPDALGHPPAKT